MRLLQFAAIAASAAAVLNPLFGDLDPQQYMNTICTASAQYKLKEKFDPLTCEKVFDAHCERWIVIPAAPADNIAMPAKQEALQKVLVATAERRACKQAYRNLVATMSAPATFAAVNPFQALVNFRGWATAKSWYERRGPLSMEPFTVAHPLMTLVIGNEDAATFWGIVATERRYQIAKMVVMGLMGDDRAASMFSLINTCVDGTTKHLTAEVNKVPIQDRTPLMNDISRELPNLSLSDMFDNGSVGSVDPTSDHDITVKSPVWMALTTDVKGWRHSVTTRIVHCVNQRFLRLVATPLTQVLQTLGDYRPILTSATFYDSNVYSEDELAHDVQGDKKDAAKHQAHFQRISVYLDELAKEFKPLNAQGQPTDNGRQGVSITSDQLVWALLDVQALGHLGNPASSVNDIVPPHPAAHPAGVDIASIPDLGYWPYGIGRVPNLAAALSARSAVFTAFLKSLRTTCDACRDHSKQLTTGVMAIVRQKLAALVDINVPAGRDLGPQGQAAYAEAVEGELSNMARNIIYAETSLLADRCRQYKDFLVRYHANDGANIKAAVLACNNLRAISLFFAPEGARTVGALWHVLPTLQMGHYGLPLGTPLLLPAYIENMGNFFHKLAGVSGPSNAVVTRDNGADRPCSDVRRNVIIDTLGKGGKYLYRSTDALVRLDGGFNAGMPGAPRAPAAGVCAPEGAVPHAPGPSGPALPPSRFEDVALETAIAAAEGHFCPPSNPDPTGTGAPKVTTRALRASQQQVISPLSSDSTHMQAAAVAKDAAAVAAAAKAILADHAEAKQQAAAAQRFESVSDSESHEAVAASDYTAARIVPTTEQELIAYMCGASRSLAFKSTDAAPVDAACLRAIPNIAAAVGPGPQNAAAAAALTARLTRATEALGGIHKAYASLSTPSTPLRAGWEGSRKLNNRDVVTESFSNEMAIALRDPRPVFDQILRGTRTVLAGGLSRMLGEAGCFDGRGGIIADCMPSLSPMGCSFNLPAGPGAGGEVPTPEDATRAVQALGALNDALHSGGAGPKAFSWDALIEFIKKKVEGHMAVELGIRPS